jgi:hypothetical protein
MRARSAVRERIPTPCLQDRFQDSRRPRRSWSEGLMLNAEATTSAWRPVRRMSGHSENVPAAHSSRTCPCEPSRPPAGSRPSADRHARQRSSCESTWATDAIIEGQEDARIAINKDGSIGLKIGEIIRATNQQTTSARRTRLRNQLSTILAPHGWKELRPNVYRQSKTKDETT